MTEIPRPLVVRRSVAFAQAVFDGVTDVEDVRAVCCTLQVVPNRLEAGLVPVVVDPESACRHQLRPPVIVDAIMAKRNTGTAIGDAELVVGLGPGFMAGVDCHAVVETNRGHGLGRVIWKGSAEPDTGQPGTLPGIPPGIRRAFYAPMAGTVHAYAEIGKRLTKGEPIASMAANQKEQSMISAPFDGVLRGLIHPSVHVAPGTKIGDIDPRIQPENCFTVSDKSLAIGGAVLEAVLATIHSGSLYANVEGGTV